jgi:hypothetical protein
MKFRTVLVLLTLVAPAMPAAGDWLVARDGGRVETKGPWQVKGKLVVFTQTNGSLGSLRLADVDLDASRKATADAASAQAEAAKPAAPAPPKKKLAVLTDQSFRKTAPPTAAVVAPPAQEGAPAPAPGESGPLTVSSWKQINVPKGGLEIQGTLHNTTDRLIVNPSVEVRLYDDAGETLGSAPGVLSASTIPPLGTVDFRATFSGAYTVFAEVKFEPRGLPLDVGPGGPREPKPEDSSPPR